MDGKERKKDFRILCCSRCGWSSMGIEAEEVDGKLMYYVQCDYCDMRGPSAESQFDAIELWNEHNEESDDDLHV